MAKETLKTRSSIEIGDKRDDASNAIGLLGVGVCECVCGSAIGLLGVGVCECVCGSAIGSITLQMQ